MRRAAALALLLAGCGAPAPSPAPPAEAPHAGAPAMSAGALELYYHLPGPTLGEARQPVFQLKAERFEFDETRKEYSFEEATIEIAEEAGRGPMNIEGKRGTYVEGNSARLEGGVRAVSEDTSISMEDLTYTLPAEDRPGAIETEHPVTLRSQSQQLDAVSLTLNPATRDCIMKDATGLIHLGKDTP